MMFGYACDETPELMPYPISLAHKLTRKLTEVRKNGTLGYLRPDGKSQVTVEYDDGKPSRLDAVVLSTQHDPDVTQEQIHEDIKKYVFDEVLPKELVNEKTCAIIFETVQGEGGVYPAKKEFIEGVRKLCDEKGILLILDEIQCGMGRTGSMFAYQQYGVKPDIVTVAKALGCGVPVGAFAAKDEVAKALVPGDHGTTYGGNPLACAAAVKVFELFDSLKVLDNVKEVGTYLASELDKIVAEYDIATERRGMGLIQGLQLSVNPKDVIANALDNGLILFSAGTNVIRFVPPLVITKADVDEMIVRLKKSLDSCR